MKTGIFFKPTQNLQLWCSISGQLLQGEGEDGHALPGENLDLSSSTLNLGGTSLKMTLRLRHCISRNFPSPEIVSQRQRSTLTLTLICLEGNVDSSAGDLKNLREFVKPCSKDDGENATRALAEIFEGYSARHSCVCDVFIYQQHTHSNQTWHIRNCGDNCSSHQLANEYYDVPLWLLWGMNGEITAENNVRIQVEYKVW